MPRVVAVVVNWNQPQLTIRCVDGLRDQAGPDELEIVIVDNGSTDDSLAELQAAGWSDCIVAMKRNVGFGAGVNAAVAASPADLYLLVNNDAVPQADFIRLLLAAEAQASAATGAFTAQIHLSGTFERAPSTGGSTPVFEARNGVRWSRSESGTRLINSTGGVIDASGNGSDRNWLDPIGTKAPAEVFAFSGGGALLRRAALDDVGGFDESLFMYYEDTELSWRLRRRGWLVQYVEGAVLIHDHAASSGTTSDLFLFRNAQNRIIVALWHSPGRVVALAILRTVARIAMDLASTSHRARGRLLTRALGGIVAALPRHLRHRRAESALSIIPASRIHTGP